MRKTLPFRSLVSLIAVALGVLSLPLTAQAEEPTPLATHQSVLVAARELGTAHAAKAVEHLARGLDSEAWSADGMSLAGKKGKDVFKSDEKAADQLAKDGADSLAADLAGAARALALAAGATGDEKASKELAKGDKELAEGRADKAIEGYRKAYEKAIKDAGAQASMETPLEIDPALIPDGGTGTVYTFTFVDRNDPSRTLIVSGASDSNEGFLYDGAFANTDTYLDADGVMQVHVSCSDAFAGGIGQKSDPEPDSQWLVAFADIWKLRNGEVAKACHVIGTGGDVPYEDPYAGG